jgi:hypothetical protein
VRYAWSGLILGAERSAVSGAFWSKFQTTEVVPWSGTVTRQYHFPGASGASGLKGDWRFS